MNEEQGAQQHFIELCALLGVPPPEGDADYVFEKGNVAHGAPMRFERWLALAG